MMLNKFIVLMLLLVSDVCLADWNVRPMANSTTITRASINSDSAISLAFSGSRYPPNQSAFACNVPAGSELYNTKKYLVWFLENINVNGRKIDFEAPEKMYDSIATNGYFTVVRHRWIDGGNTLVLIGQDFNYPTRTIKCWEGQTESTSGSLYGKPVGVSLPAGTHWINLGFRVIRVQATESVDTVYNLAMSYRNSAPVTNLRAPITIASYCIYKNGNSIVLNHGRFAAGTGNGKEASAAIEYECNLESATPKITFTGGNVSSNKIRICDDLVSELSATTVRNGQYGFRTVFKSTLSGNASSSCEGAFSKSAIATISPP